MEKVKIIECSIVKCLPSYEVLVEGLPEVTTTMQVAATDVNGDTWIHRWIYEEGHREWGDGEDGGIEIVSNSPRLERFVKKVRRDGYIDTDFWEPATPPCEVFSDRSDFY